MNTIEERIVAMKDRMAKLQKRGSVTKKATKQEIFNHVISLCPDCKGEQFVAWINEDGQKKSKWCFTCKGSGIDPKEACYQRAFVFAK
jgi:hypothetical protein